MNKKVLSAVIAVIVVIVLVVAVLEVVVLPTPKASMTVSVSSSSSSVGQNLTFAAFISGGTPSKVIFNFGDGTTGKASHLLGNEYTVTHSYSSAGKYLVTANATINGKYVNNFKSIDEVTVMPVTVSLSLASEITAPTIITPSQIISPGSTIILTASTLQPPTATNWTIGYYIWNFGDRTADIAYTVFNTSSETFMAENVSHIYSVGGIYAVTLGVITFNATNYVPITYTSNGINYTYYPVSDLKSILSSSGNYYNTTYIATIVVNSTAQLLTSTLPVSNPNEIINTEVAPGSPYSLDPAVEYETVGLEIIFNVYESLIAYNGSSTTSFFPVVATEIPTIANGGVSANGLNYTFYMRSGLKFSNGDPVTAWDAYTSYVRLLLFMLGTPGTPGWIMGQDLLPGGGYAPGAVSYQNITAALTVNNATQTLTFHLLKPDPAFIDYVADQEIASITDYSWIVAHGAGITFTPAGFAAYMSQGNEVDYNNYIRYNAMGSGPYMIKNYVIGQSILLAPNPDFTPLPGVPGYNYTITNSVYIVWEKDAATALLVAESGLTDMVTSLPDMDYPIMSHLAAEGKITITTFPSLDIYTYTFTWNVNVSYMQAIFGSQYHMPFDYFANLDVRKAFAYALNYTDFIDDLLGNSIYGADFGFPLAGIIPLGMAGYIPTNKLYNVPTYNLSLAKQFMMESGMYNVSVNIPMIITDGEPAEYAGAGMWAQSLNAMDPNIHASPIYLAWDEMYGFQVPGENTMPIYPFMWSPDYPYPSDYVHSLLYEGGWIPYGNGWNATNLLQWGFTNESYQFQNMTNLITNASQQVNGTMALKYYDEAELISVNLTLYVYTYQATTILFYSPSIKGVQYEGNPVYAGLADTLYFYLTKT